MLRDARRAIAGLGSSASFAAGYPGTVYRLSRIAEQFRPDIINIHFVGDQALYFLPLLVRSSAAFVTSIHGAEIEQYPRQMALRRWMLRHMLRRSDLVLSNSSHLLGQARRIAPGLDAKAAVVGNGVGVPEFPCTSRGISEQPYLFAAGRFVEKKGFDVLIRAMAVVAQRMNDIALKLAGEGPELARCTQLAESLGVADRITFLGGVAHEQVLRLMHGAAVVLVPSRQEPFGMVVLEAMACGTPVVATRVGGIPEILMPMQEGLLVEPERPGEMARAIERLVHDGALREAMGRRGRAKVLHGFTWDTVAERYEQAYSRALRTAGHRHRPGQQPGAVDAQ
jgi:glycosyltransferase involved in cell wall biosynthesis